KYSKDTIRRYLENPSQYEEQLREVSQYLILVSTRYMKLLYYFAHMLTLDNILIPLNTDNMDKNKFKTTYKKITTFVENYNIKDTFSEIIKILLLDGVYFGYERSQGNSIMVQRLPTNYCKITGIEDGVYTFSFDFSYFNNHDINNFPSEFSVLYDNYKQTRISWQELDSKYSVCFKFNKEISFNCPPFIQLYEELMDIEDIKDLKKQRVKLDNFKLLLQKIPLKKDPKNERDLVFTRDTVKGFHDNIKKGLPPGIALISSPMEIEDFSFERKKDRIEDNVEKAEEELFNSAGISSAVFNGADNSIALNRSINQDESIMFSILRQIERHFRKRLYFIDSVQRFKLFFPDLTIYNRNDMIDSMLRLSQFGMPKSLLFAAVGFSATDIVNLSNLENDYLNLVDKLVPLVSSHTAGMLDEGGRPLKDENDLSDQGVKQRDQNKNKNKPK
ncbi:MAG: hypothetical protein PHU66_08040, partial [Bacteroidaceae bacterium]|nr:hypothetical protein [Bacteroidaceae bacterium]